MQHTPLTLRYMEGKYTAPFDEFEQNRTIEHEANTAHCQELYRRLQRGAQSGQEQVWYH
jgi:hypothetical protein